VNPLDPTKPPVPKLGGPPGRAVGPNRRLITLAEAAELLGMSTVSVRRLIWAGKLPVVRLTRRVQIDVRDLEHLIAQSKQRIDW
jgi:excisionase family DNA binding protein